MSDERPGGKGGVAAKTQTRQSRPSAAEGRCGPQRAGRRGAAPEARLRRRGWRAGLVPRSGGISLFVGSAILILSSYAAATVAMLYGKKRRESQPQPGDFEQGPEQGFDHGPPLCQVSATDERIGVAEFLMDGW